MYKVIWSFGVTFRKLWQTSTNPSRDASRTNSPRSQVKPTHMRVCAFVYTHTHLLNFSNFRVWSHKGGLLRSRTYRMVCMRCVCMYIHVFDCMHVCMHSSMFAHMHGMGCFERIPVHGFILLILLFYMHTQIHIVICFLWFTTGEVCLT
jgi:hypothetical protein